MNEAKIVNSSEISTEKPSAFVGTAAQISAIHREVRAAKARLVTESGYSRNHTAIARADKRLRKALAAEASIGAVSDRDAAEWELTAAQQKVDEFAGYDRSKSPNAVRADKALAEIQLIVDAMDAKPLPTVSERGFYTTTHRGQAVAWFETKHEKRAGGVRTLRHVYLDDDAWSNLTFRKGTVTEMTIVGNAERAPERFRVLVAEHVVEADGSEPAHF